MELEKWNLTWEPHWTYGERKILSFPYSVNVSDRGSKRNHINSVPSRTSTGPRGWWWEVSILHVPGFPASLLSRKCLSFAFSSPFYKGLRINGLRIRPKKYLQYFSFKRVSLSKLFFFKVKHSVACVILPLLTIAKGKLMWLNKCSLILSR